MKNKNKGFTLAELLIVVAIIAVLVAISIPIFNNQLKKARLATNQANGRAAFSAAEAAYLDYVAGHGSVPVNTDSYDKKWVTYTYPELFMTVLIPVLPSAVLILNDQ